MTIKNQALTSNGDTPFRNGRHAVGCMCGQGSFSTVGDQKVCMGDVAWSRRHKRGLGAVGGGIGNRIHTHWTKRHSDTARVLPPDQRNRVPYHLSTRCESASVHLCFFCCYCLVGGWYRAFSANYFVSNSYLLIDCPFVQQIARASLLCLYR